MFEKWLKKEEAIVQAPEVKKEEVVVKKEIKIKSKEVTISKCMKITFKNGSSLSYSQKFNKGKELGFIEMFKGFYLWYMTKESDKYLFEYDYGARVMFRDKIEGIEFLTEESE